MVSHKNAIVWILIIMKIVRYMTVIKNSLEFLILRKDRKAQKKGL